jgi:hypothetical protein
MQTYLLARCSKEQQKIKDSAINIHTYYIYSIYIYIYRFYYAFGTLVVAPQLAILEKSMAFPVRSTAACEPLEAPPHRHGHR